MSAREQIGKEVQKAVKPLVADLAKQNVLSLSKEIVPLVVNQTKSKLSLMKTIPKDPEISNVLEFLPGDVSSI